MERFAWKGRIKEGMQEEYKRRHDEIWPEMLALLKLSSLRKPRPQAQLSTNGTIIWKTCSTWSWIRKPAPSRSCA